MCTPVIICDYSTDPIFSKLLLCFFIIIIIIINRHNQQHSPKTQWFSFLIFLCSLQEKKDEQTQSTIFIVHNNCLYVFFSCSWGGVCPLSSYFLKKKYKPEEQFPFYYYFRLCTVRCLYIMCLYEDVLVYKYKMSSNSSETKDFEVTYYQPIQRDFYSNIRDE